MHGPIGCSGVQPLPKRRHSKGRHDPAQHVAALAAGDLLGLRRRHVEPLRRVPRGELLADVQSGARDHADAAPLGVGGLEHLGHRRLRGRVAVRVDTAPVRDLDLGAALGDLLREHPHALEHVDRLEAGRDTGYVVLRGEEAVRLRADDRGDVAGQDEAVDLRRPGRSRAPRAPWGRSCAPTAR